MNSHHRQVSFPFRERWAPGEVVRFHARVTLMEANIIRLRAALFYGFLRPIISYSASLLVLANKWFVFSAPCTVNGREAFCSNPMVQFGLFFIIGPFDFKQTLLLNNGSFSETRGLLSITSLWKYTTFQVLLFVAKSYSAVMSSVWSHSSRIVSITCLLEKGFPLYGLEFFCLVFFHLSLLVVLSTEKHLTAFKYGME